MTSSMPPPPEWSPGSTPPPGYPPAPAYPGMPPYPTQPAYAGPPPAEPPRPRELHIVLGLLVANVVLSVVLTVVTIVFRHSLANYQLDHRHITDPQRREQLRNGYIGTIVGRVIGNIVVSIVYAFIVRALLRGRRWAYRRVIWIGGIGILGLLYIQLSPYPAWMRVEQLVQAVVLAALLYFVLRPPVRAYFAKELPGRNIRRFQKS